MSTPYGQATLFGTWDGTNAPSITYKELGGSSATARKLIAMELRFKPDATIDNINDGNGAPSGYNKRRGIWVVSGDFYVRADTKANALTAILPPIDLTTIVLDDFVGNNHALLNGTWVYKTGADVSFSEGEAKITLEMERQFKGDGTEVTASTLLTAIS